MDNFFLIINIFRREKDHKAAYCSQKVPTSSYIAAADPHLSHYMKHLTPYAFRFVQKQFELKKCVAIILHQEDSVCFALKTLDRSEHIYKNVATTSCSCNFWLSMRLPCCHILFVRESLGMHLFEEVLCDHRWTLEYYKFCHSLLCSESPKMLSASITEVPSKKNSKVLSQVHNMYCEISFSLVFQSIIIQFEKFRKASIIATQLAALVSECSGVEFQSRCELLKQLLHAWEQKINVKLDAVAGISNNPTVYKNY